MNGHRPGKPHVTTRPDSAPTNGVDAPRALVVGVPAETYDGERRVALGGHRIADAVRAALLK